MILTLAPEQLLTISMLAIKVSYQGREIWFPKSRVIMTVGVDTIRVFVPDWLMKARGL